MTKKPTMSNIFRISNNVRLLFTHQNLFFVLLVFMVSFVGSSCRQKGSQPSFDYSQIRQQSEGSSGTVVSAHPLATQIGVNVLEKGGNAIDAMVATQFALAVTCPRAGNIGGGGFMIVKMANGESAALDFREMAPNAASKDMYLDNKGNVIDKMSQDGHMAVGVPGTVDGMVKAHKKYGKLPFGTLLSPAILLAKNGFVISESEADRINKYQSDFVTYNDESCPFVKEKKWKPLDLLVQKDLAQSLTRIKEEGRAGFYLGVTAAKLVSEMQEGGGIITLKDLENYHSIWREPISAKYQEYEVLSMPLPSSGGIILAQILTMLEQIDIGKYGTTKYIHTLAEIEKRAYADRAEYLGDNDFINVPLDRLLDTNYLKLKMADFNENLATVSDQIFSDKESKTLESYETTHISVVDKQGNAVSTTVTLNGNYGSKVMVDGAGFFLNNEMDDFSAKPGVPNLYGLVGSEANAIEAKKRMLSSMTPTITTKNGQVHMLLGSPGGSTIITSVLQVFLNVVLHGMTLEQAQVEPRFHHQWLPDHILVEEGAFDKAILDSLKSIGHKISSTKTIGKVKAILIERERQKGAGDPRNADDCAMSIE